jgi:transposase
LPPSRPDLKSPGPRCTTAERRFALQRMNSRFQADPSLIRQRRCASEHPFGTIKRMTAGGRFLTRGLNKARAEAALSVLAYNIIRTINLVGVATLRASLA